MSRRKRNSVGPVRSATSSRRRAACREGRVPASSICTRAFRSSGAPGFKMFRGEAKLLGERQEFLRAGHVLNRIDGPAGARFFERIGRVPTISAATVISLPFALPFQFVERERAHGPSGANRIFEQVAGDVEAGAWRIRWSGALLRSHGGGIRAIRNGHVECNGGFLPERPVLADSLARAAR